MYTVSSIISMSRFNESNVLPLSSQCHRDFLPFFQVNILCLQPFGVELVSRSVHVITLCCGVRVWKSWEHWWQHNKLWNMGWQVGLGENFFDWAWGWVWLFEMKMIKSVYLEQNLRGTGCGRQIWRFISVKVCGFKPFLSISFVTMELHQTFIYLYPSLKLEASSNDVCLAGRLGIVLRPRFSHVFLRQSILFEPWCWRGHKFHLLYPQSPWLIYISCYHASC